MSAVLSVSRIITLQAQAVKVALGPNGSTMGLIDALLVKLNNKAGYRVEKLIGQEHSGGMRIKLMRENDPELIAFPDDWILVSDATYDDTNGWQVKSTSRAHIYGQAKGMSGTAANFVDTWTIAPDANNPLTWDATTNPPTLIAKDGLTALLQFNVPSSANGPFAYQVLLKDTTANTNSQLSPTWTMDDHGVIQMTIPNLIDTHGYNAKVKVTATNYAGVTATSVSSNDIVAAVDVPEPDPPPVGPMMVHRAGMPGGVPLTPGLMTPQPKTRVNN